MIRVLVADDEQLLRTALASLLELHGMRVVAQCANGAEVLTQADRAEIDVFLLDLEMPGLGGLDAAKGLLAEQPDRAIIIVTRHARPGVLRSALAAGVRGFVAKDTPFEELASIIEHVHTGGGRYVDMELALSAISVDCPLSERETDALRLTEEGRSVSEIAEILHLAPGTVRNYLSDAIAKLGASGRHDAARQARVHGWI